MSALRFKSIDIIKQVSIRVCPLCESEHNKIYSSGYDFELETCGNEWFFYECIECGCVWLNPRPSEDDLKIIYPKNYYAYESDISALSKFAKNNIDKIKMKKVLKKYNLFGNYLDIGFGDGRYLKIANKLGFNSGNIYGLDLRATKDKNLHQFNLCYGRIEECNFFCESFFDLVTMFHVIEHVADVNLVVEKIGKILKKGGVLVLETPNISSIDAKLFKGKWWGGYHIPRHWVLFDNITIRKLLERKGFFVEGFSYQTGHSFWMYSFHHMLKYNKYFNCKLLYSLFNPLKSVFIIACFTLFDILRSKLGMKTSSMLVIARKL